MKDRKTKSQTSHTHNFIDYKLVPKMQYQSSYSYMHESKPEDQNGIYRHLKSQKIINEIFGRIFGNKNPKKITKSEM